MIRSSFAAVAIVAIVAVGGAAVWLNRSQPPLPDGQRRRASRQSIAQA